MRAAGFVVFEQGFAVATEVLQLDEGADTREHALAYRVGQVGLDAVCPGSASAQERGEHQAVVAPDAQPKLGIAAIALDVGVFVLVEIEPELWLDANIGTVVGQAVAPFGTGKQGVDAARFFAVAAIGFMLVAA